MPVIIPERPAGTPPDPAPPGLWTRLGWFVALYVLGIGSVGIVAYGLRLWIKA